MVDKTEAVDLVLGDWGESLRVNGRAVTGTFTLGSSETDDREDQAGPGRKRRRQAIASVPGTTDVKEDDEVERLEDDTVWIVADVREGARGMKICELRTAEQITTGMI